MKRLSLTIGALLGGWLSVSVLAQGPSPAQIQAALRAFLTQAHTWTATQTFAGISVSSCTGCGGGSITGSDTQVLFFDGANNPAGDAALRFNKTSPVELLLGDGTDNVYLTFNLGAIIRSPASSTPGVNSDIEIQPGPDSAIRNGGNFTVTGGAATHGGNGGGIYLFAGSGDTFGGEIEIFAGNAGAATGANITLQNAAGTGVGNKSGDIVFRMQSGMGGASDGVISYRTGSIEVGNLAITSTGAIQRTDTTPGHTFSLSAYDNDTGPAYVTCATLTNGNSPTFVLTNANGCTITIAGASLVTPALGVATATSVASGLYTDSSTPASIASTSANSCGTSSPTLNTGSSNSRGSFNVGATSGTDCTLTFSTAASHFWACSVSDETSAVLVRAVEVNTTSTKFQGLFTAADKIGYVCAPY